MQSSDVIPIFGALRLLISLYNQVEALLHHTKLKGQVVWELKTDFRFLPSVIAEVLPALNTGNSHFDRNFFRVVQLMCKALQDARAALDDYVLSSIHLWQVRSLNRRLSDARSRIRHAVSLYNTYCNTKQLLFNPSITMLDESLARLRDSLQAFEIGPDTPQCPKKILKLVAKLRCNKCNIDSVQKYISNEELDHFCSVGGLEALVQFLGSTSFAVQKQALTNLQSLLVQNNGIKRRFGSVPGALEQLASLVSTCTGEIQGGALHILRVMLQNSEYIMYVGRIVEPKFLTCLVQFLGNSSPYVQANAAGVLWELSVIPENRPKIVRAAPDHQVLDRLVMLFNSPTVTTQFCAGATLYNLCTIQEVRTAVLGLGVGILSERLLILLNSSLRARDHLRGSQRRLVEEMPTAGVIGWAVAMLDSESQTEQGRGLDVLQKLPEQLMGVAVGEGTIARLVELLHKRDSEEILTKAAMVLYRISIPDENELKIAVQDGAITKMMAMLGEHRSPALRQAAVKVIESLSFNPINRNRIIEEEDSIPHLAALLFVPSPECQASAASALWNLANTNAINKSTVASSPGLLHRLIDLLASDSSLVQEKAAGTLMNLFHSNTIRSLTTLPRVIFSRLVHLLQSSSTLVHQNAVGALHNLSINQDNAAEIAAIPEAIPALVNLLSSMSVLVQEYAAGAIANLAYDKETRGRIKAMGASSLAKLLRELRLSRANAVKAQASRAITVLQI